MSAAIPPLPQYALWRGTQLKYRDNFTLPLPPTPFSEANSHSSAVMESPVLQSCSLYYLLIIAQQLF